MLEKFLDRTEYSSYEDFKANCRLKVPEKFNFAYDVVDAWAAEDPGKRALVHLDDAGNVQTFTFADVRDRSNQAARAMALRS